MIIDKRRRKCTISTTIQCLCTKGKIMIRMEMRLETNAVGPSPSFDCLTETMHSPQPKISPSERWFFINVVVKKSKSDVPKKIISKKGSAAVPWAPQYKKIFDPFQWSITSKVGSNDEMFRCSLKPAILFLVKCKNASSLRMTANCCLFTMVHCPFLVLIDTISVVIQRC